MKNFSGTMFWVVLSKLYDLVLLVVAIVASMKIGGVLQASISWGLLLLPVYGPVIIAAFVVAFMLARERNRKIKRKNRRREREKIMADHGVCSMCKITHVRQSLAQCPECGFLYCLTCHTKECHNPECSRYRELKTVNQHGKPEKHTSMTRPPDDTVTGFIGLDDYVQPMPHKDKVTT